MKRLLTSSLLVMGLLTFGSAAAQNTPAFPGAEGHGRYVTGGRGGKIVHVTNLNDSGTGSFRQAVSGSEKKIVVFDVGGVIALNSDVNIGANTTIMGQTAPSPGITLRYYTVQFSGGNVIIRYLRSRRGEERNVNDGADAIWTRNKTGIILDHCSFSWSIDEVASFYDNNNFTMQWCTICESLNSGHSKGDHGYGGIWGGKLASFHHNLIAHVANRSPRFNGARYNWAGYSGNQFYTQYLWENAVQAENVDFRNCVVYNADGCYGGPGGGQINMVNNYYKSGPSATIKKVTLVTVGASGNASGYPIYWDMTSRYYLEGNMIDNKAAGWDKISYDSGTETINGDHYSKDPNHYYGSGVDYQTINGTDYVRIRLDEPAPTGDVTTHAAQEAFSKVLAYAGASLNRDNVDERYATEAENGTVTYKGSTSGMYGRIDKVADCQGYTEANFGTGSRPAGFDSDKDGMPDEWETANGLNPNSANDASLYTIDPMKYYTNVEVYCNQLVQHIMLAGNADAVEPFNDYYPACYDESGTLQPAVNMPEQQETSEVSYELSQSTNEGNNTSSTYYFQNGVTITNVKNKNYAAGSNNGIKYSAGVQYTINLPADVTIDNVTFTGYDNYAEADAYLGEVNGVNYDSSVYLFPKKVDSQTQVVSHSVALSPAATSQLTFTPQGKQVVLSISLKGSKGTATGLRDVHSPVVSSSYYNLQGVSIDCPQRGVVIEVQRHADGSRTVRKVSL